METEKLENYDKLPEEHDLVLKYKPKAVGLGGEQVVYSLEDHPNVVIKVSKHKVKDSVIKMGEDGLVETDPLLEEWAKETYAEEIRIKNEEIKKLRDFFGGEHTLKERQYLMRVPVSEELLSEVFVNDYVGRVLPESVKNTSEVWTSVSVQEKCDEINNPDRLALSYGGFIEGKDLDPKEYERITGLVIGQGENKFNSQEFLTLQDQSKKKGFSQLMELARSDEKLKEQLESFIKKAIAFTKETGQILALAGDDNVFL